MHTSIYLYLLVGCPKGGEVLELSVRILSWRWLMDRYLKMRGRSPTIVSFLLNISGMLLFAWEFVS